MHAHSKATNIKYNPLTIYNHSVSSACHENIIHECTITIERAVTNILSSAWVCMYNTLCSYSL